MELQTGSATELSLELFLETELEKELEKKSSMNDSKRKGFGANVLTAFRKKSPTLKECEGRSPMSRWEMNFGWL
jgi:hypothetical protein